MIQKGLKDPRINFATVTRINLSDNLKHAKIYISIIGTEVENEKTLDGFKSARGFIRGQIGKNLYLKYVPELEFLKDENPEHADKVSKLLEQIKSGRST